MFLPLELHQMTSPKTAYDFLDSLLDTSSMVKTSADEVTLYGEYFVKSWMGIIKSSGIF
jgi:ubiquinone biosynthesis protein COQ9